MERRDQSHNERREQSHNERRDQSRDERRDQSRDERREQPHAERRDQSRDERRDQGHTERRDNAQCVRQLFEQVYNKGDLNALDSLCTADIKLHDVARGGTRSGLNEYKANEKTYITAFPHKELKIDELIDAGDKVCVRWTCKGKHDGKLQDISATHRNFTISGITVYTFKNGKICDICQNWDRLGLLEQLGVLEREPALHG